MYKRYHVFIKFLSSFHVIIVLVEPWKNLSTVPNWYSGLSDDKKKNSTSSAPVSSRTSSIYGSNAVKTSSITADNRPTFPNQNNKPVKYGTGVSHLETFGVEKSSQPGKTQESEFSAFGMFANKQILNKEPSGKKKRGTRGGKKKKKADKENPPSGTHQDYTVNISDPSDPYMDMYGYNNTTPQQQTSGISSEAPKDWGNFKIPKQSPSDMKKESTGQETKLDYIDLTQDDAKDDQSGGKHTSY